MAISPASVAQDAEWLVHRFEETADRLHFRKVSRDAHRKATFLTDEYLGAEPNPFVMTRGEAISSAAPPGAVHFIFHSAFCCSTLLARVFDIPGKAMGLKEPQILNDIAGWRLRGAPGARVAEVLDHALRLLARPLSPGEATIIKPSNLLNGLAPAMMKLRPEARAVLLHAPLPIFLKSVAKKGLDGRLWVRDLMSKQIREGLVDLGFEHWDYLGLTDLQSAAVGWLTQQALFEKWVADHPQRIRLLDSETLLERPHDSVTALARLFGVDLDRAAIDAIVSGPAFGTNSKSGQAFGRSDRAAEYEAASEAHADEIAKVAAWAESIAKGAGISLEAPSGTRLLAARAQITAQAVERSASDISAVIAAAERSLQSGDMAGAIMGFETAVSLDPSLADCWYNLGYLRRCLRQYPQAIHAYQRAIDAGIARPEEVRLNLAVIRSELLGDVEGAARELNAATDAEPNFVPAWLNLGNLYEDLGNRPLARSAYAKALEAEPDNGRAIGRMAMIDLFEGSYGDLPGKLAGHLARARSPDDAAEIGFALGHVLDAAGRYGEAFAAIERANRDNLKRPSPYPAYDRAVQARLVDDIMATFADAAAVPGDAAEAPVFICGMFRSGSTLAEQILGRHPRITAGGELETLPALVAERLSPFPQALKSFDSGAMAALSQAYLDEIATLFPNRDLLTDKRPDNFLYIGLIKRLFPNARFIHTVRNPADTMISVYFGNFAPSITYASNLGDIAHWYQQYERLMAHWQRLYADSIHTLDYERLVSEPRPVIAEALGFLGLDWDEQCLGGNAASSPVRTLSVWQVRQPLHTRSSGRAHHYAAELAKHGIITR